MAAEPRFVPKDDEVPIEKARDIASDIVDVLLLNEASLNDALVALSIAMCFTVQQYDRPYTALEEAVDDIIANLNASTDAATQAASDEGTPAAGLD